MTHLEAFVLAVALAMDCFTVSIASGIILKKIKLRPMFIMATLFGLFQAVNPIIGWKGVGYCSTLIESFDHWIAFLILVFLGVRMIVEAFKVEEKKSFNPESLKVMFTMAIATSIDAFAVGISFSCMGINSFAQLIFPLLMIGVVSFLFSIGGLFMGVKFGERYAKKLRAELWGGLILVLIGVKVLVEHTLM